MDADLTFVSESVFQGVFDCCRYVVCLHYRYFRIDHYMGNDYEGDSVSSGLELMDILDSGHRGRCGDDFLFDVFRQGCVKEFREAWQGYLYGDDDDRYADAA